MSRFILLLLAFVVANTVNVIGTDNQLNFKSSQLDKCQLSCGTKGDLPLTEINGGLYYIHVDDKKKMNWYEAKDFCREHNMELATIETVTENEAIKQHISSLIKDDDDYIRSSVQFFRIGLNDLGKNGVYRWDSTGKITEFTDWDKNEPNNSGGPEDCVEIRKYRGIVKWNDISCTISGRFICEVTSNNLLYLHAN